MVQGRPKYLQGTKVFESAKSLYFSSNTLGILFQIATISNFGKPGSKLSTRI